ncbi:DUF3302 domain-containing protein [Photobacterium sanguinicancri]|uniref:DUF3302 domain-containing protein n=1 Tax=Photobacterium sanguinicancri TaxID=875932 RepID=A0AAW7Y6J7_9GAMM|nr:DUF3302 domain-containing protein [Photobacterium sanguinicancri]MDO6543984.1 DUF3302 domain-containing protein [Photobacterium sanguinicancri]
MFLDYFALGLLVFVALVLFYGIIVIHDIPYEISKERDHPHQDAIHYAGWVSLFTLHALWPFLWIWATLWRKDRGWGFQKIQAEQNELHHQINTLSAQVELLSHKIATLEGTPKPVSGSVQSDHTQGNQSQSDQTGEEK